MIQQTVLQNRGVTLVEVMVALTVLLIVFLGLIQTSIVVVQANMRNLLRDEAVSITSDEMARLRTANYDDLNGDGVVDPSPVLLFRRDQTRDFRQSVSVPFAVQVRADGLVNSFGGNVGKQITITTMWSWQGENFQHQLLGTRSR